jgi:hypothetical protein
MSSKTGLGVKAPKKTFESKLLALLAPFRAEAPARENAIMLDAEQQAEPELSGDLNWTVGLRRGDDLPTLQLSIVAQAGAGMALRFHPCAQIDPRAKTVTETREDRR